jgi:hypothetical protein
MIKKYISEEIVFHDILQSAKIIQTWWNTQSYITYEFILPFQFYMESSIHVISWKTSIWRFSFKQT